MADFYTYRNEVAGRRRKRRLFLILIVVLAVLCIGVGYFWSTPAECPRLRLPRRNPLRRSRPHPPLCPPRPPRQPRQTLPSRSASCRASDTAAWDKSEAVAATIDTEYRNTDHRMVAVPMLAL